jgi:hypothetical protein
MTAEPKALCPLCHKFVRIRVNGTLNKHGYKNNTHNKAEHKPSRCIASGKPIDYFIERAKTDV